MAKLRGRAALDWTGLEAYPTRSMFDRFGYGPEVARILGLDAEEAREAIRVSKLPALVRTGLFNYFGLWNEAHELAQNIETADGSYWHGIVHRQEPDAGNAGYWFRRVGAHPIFPALRARAVEIGYPAGAQWDPIAFIEYCERQPGQIARDMERAEWELLFDHCARQAKTGSSGSS